MYYTYILQSKKDNKYYIGSTKDLRSRIYKHNKGYVRSTKSRIPFKLIYYEISKTRQDAYRREMEIKAMKGGIQFKSLLKSSKGHRKAGSRFAG